MFVLRWLHLPILHAPRSLSALLSTAHHNERGGARRKTAEQAERWVEKSRNRYGEAEVGTTVLLAIPDVDKGRCELPNLKCVVLEKTGGGMYR